jgi:2-octaprenyl-6-methoxyphenol hydroxylase
LTPRQIDIAIVGAGPVGLALAGMLILRGVSAHKLLLLDAKTSDAAQQDPRSIALSYGSRQLLEQIAAWPVSGTPITQIHISRRGSFGRTLIDSTALNLPALGYVCRYGALVQTLTASLESKGVLIQRPASVSAVDDTADHVRLQMADGSAIDASVMVQAEGGVYGTQAKKSQQRDYQQSAIVATVCSSAPLPGRAFERFTEEGPLALLPQEDGYALVWCARPTRIADLLAQSDADFLQALQHAFGQRLGRFTKVGPRQSYALGLNADPAATARTVAIGNAAQTLHPVAGQGLNLGLRDAAVLANRLAQCTLSAPQSALEKFSAQRRTDRGMTIQITDAMARLFAATADGTPSQTVLGWALEGIDLLPPAKRLLADQMMFGTRF